MAPAGGGNCLGREHRGGSTEGGTLAREYRGGRQSEPMEGHGKETEERRPGRWEGAGECGPQR